MKNALHKDIDSANPLTRQDNYGLFGRVGFPSRREREREAVLGDWLGEERKDGVFAKFHPQARSAGVLAESIASGIKPVEIEMMETIRQKWKEIMGDDNSRHFVPMSLKNNDILEIGFYNAAWRFAMDNPQNKRLLIEKIASITGKELEGIAFVPAVNKNRSK